MSYLHVRKIWSEFDYEQNIMTGKPSHCILETTLLLDTHFQLDKCLFSAIWGGKKINNDRNMGRVRLLNSRNESRLSCKYEESYTGTKSIIALMKMRTGPGEASQHNIPILFVSGAMCMHAGYMIANVHCSRVQKWSLEQWKKIDRSLVIIRQDLPHRFILVA